jgi:SAM-dependent methyltransferase
MTLAVASGTDDTVAAARSEHRACPICDLERSILLFDNPMAPIDAIDFSYAVVACEGCGMVYASHAPDPLTIGRYYRDLSKYDFPASVADLNPFDLQRARLAATFTARLVPSSARVLDVGCSIGLYLADLARSGWPNVQGIEPAPSSVEGARRLFGLAVDVCTADAFDRYADFDVVALLAVLEHLRDPRGLFDLLARRMKRGATLIIEVPDADAFGDYEALGVRSEPYGEFSIEHINFFGEAALRRLGRDAGLTWVAGERMRYLNGTGGLLAAFRKDAGEAVAVPDAGDSVRRYVERSRVAMRSVDARLEPFIERHDAVIVYGAGSHTARLLGQSALGKASIAVVLDRNRNLAGRRIGAHRIASPDALDAFPEVPVVISTFHAMKAVVDQLARRGCNPLLPLYPEPS